MLNTTAHALKEREKSGTHHKKRVDNSNSSRVQVRAITLNDDGRKTSPKRVKEKKRPQNLE